jgi:hypothetical protein
MPNLALFKAFVADLPWGDLRAMRHVRCLGGGFAGLLLGLAAVAHAQTAGDPSAGLVPPWASTLVHEGGLPSALLVLGWWAKGITLKGIPVTASLSDEDRALFRRGLRAIEHAQGTDSEDDLKPEPGVKA